MSDTAPGQPPRTIKKRRASSAALVLRSAKAASRGAKVGRPLSYSPELCDRAIALGEKGKHWSAIARAFGIGRPTLYEWERQYPEFKNALLRARAASQAWWEDKIQSKLGAKHFQANAARLVMAGQFKEDYAERPAGSGLEALPDLLAAVEEVAQRRAVAMLPGASAKPVDVVLVKDDATPADKG